MTVRILTGDCLAILPTLADASVHCCVTSPPYYGLRSYLPAEHRDKAREIGQGASPDEYVGQLVEVFRQVRRVLRPDGTLWLNIGDCYAASGTVGGPPSKNSTLRGNGHIGGGPKMHANGGVERRLSPGIKSKDLLGIPWMLAFALRADGWFLRSDIVWAKPNPMPESVTDRPTSAHEHVFLFSKSARYFYDAAAIAQPLAEGSQVRLAQDVDGQAGSDRAHGGGGAKVNGPMKAVVGRSGNKQRLTGADRGREGSDLGGSIPWEGATANARNVWTIATQPYSGAHFATMAPDLAERCIRAGTSEHGACGRCGAPWRRTVEDSGTPDLAAQQAAGGDVRGEYHGKSRKGHAAAGVQDASSIKARTLAGMTLSRTAGWRPSCRCAAAKVAPACVLDPFAGAGTTGLVADRLGRDAVLVDLSRANTDLAAKRISADAPLFAQVDAPGDAAEVAGQVPMFAEVQ